MPEEFDPELEKETEMLFGNEMQLIDPNLPQLLTILPATQRPVFPGMALPMAFNGVELLVSLKAAVEHHDGFVGIVMINEENEEDYRESDFHEVGTVFQIIKVLEMSPGMVQVIGRGIRRFRRERVVQTEPNLRWRVSYDIQPETKPDQELKAYMLAISNEIKNLVALNPMFQEQVNMVVNQLNYDQPGQTLDVISNLVSSEKEKLQEMMETWDVGDRAKQLLAIIKDELAVAKIQSRINKQIEDGVDKQQKEYFLREQLKAIRQELGEEKEDGESITERIIQQLEGKTVPEVARETFDREISKLKTLNTQSPEFNVTRNYLETFADLPWGIFTPDANDIKEAREILDAEHYGLKDVKDNILEFLATILKRSSVAGSIICMVGPPGVGKTSIGQSIAKALGREFYRFSVGGMRDEAEIKGHRRTYIGAMPGKLIQAVQRAKTSNPVIMLDEIDKISQGAQGDPASALLEVLDPEQNETFVDHYLDVPFDLSNVLFVCTANQLDTIPGPLLDRMEVIRLSGYVLEEKVEIAKRYLVPKQLKEHGFAEDEVTFEAEALDFLADRYAREAGVRNLEKQLRKIIRKLVLRQAESDEVNFVVTKDLVSEMLGKPRFNNEKLYEKAMPGVVLGLAYTSMGGATLYIEARGIPASSPGFRLTGQLGDVMKESAQIALSYVKSLLSKEGLDFFDKHQVHLHVPAGATPKDGPSAGITMALALYTLATGQPPIDDLAMTGELTLTGRVLPIGGVKEKTIGARRVGITNLIFPAENKRDWEELDDYIKEGLNANFATYFEDVLEVALPGRIPG
ncbi:endopeptidase La [Neolewinella agarilytica]|uniref:Lon protease n=1 Tax=Neolewinella agarilytica TaxID=478744 RepID=A0A1H9KXG2_9BACT|nr:endopeptidase La [Neolewinella agarilytica]SER03473.1 ATP dependent PIM1 peptidase. Serine peptidase. MEROPS family S16 [Neolewinella agarilytica]